MSGRSAHVRKKINDPKASDKGSGVGRGRANSAGSGRASSREDYGPPHEYPLSPGMGYGTANARLLKFSEPIRGNDFPNYRPEIASFSNQSNGSQSGGSDPGMGDTHVPRYQGPMPDLAYARGTKPVLKTEDMSGIERSGFRTAVDKKSEGVRKGITKAFSFGTKKKKKKESEVDLRSPSSAGSRPYEDYVVSPDAEERPPLPKQYPHPVLTAGDMERYYMASPPTPSFKISPVPQPVAPPTMRWMGAGRPVQRWNKLRKDPELWDPNGDVLVYFGHKGQSPRPNPSFRLSSHIIEATESRSLITLLREGSTDDEDINMQMQMPPSPIGAPPMVHRGGSNHLGPGYSQAGQPTPPISDDTSLAEADGQISYEMYFPTPSNLNRIDTHRHAITTRNVFALLYHASLVGFTLYQALSDLLERLESYMPQDADNVGTILNYLSARGIDDPRNDPETAVSILAWSETPDVRWEEGWREAFVHCAGMYPRLEACADFKNLTPITRALLERACLETQLRVQSAEERLTEFAYGDMWPSSGPIASGPGRAAADRLQRFFVAHYSAIYGTWPPQQQPQMASARTAEGEELWLTRTVAQKLAKDFGALYDYLVNRGIVWDESEFRSGRKWELVSALGDKSFDADTPDLPLTDLLIEFDNRQRFPHIPHPYPLVPVSIQPSNNPRATSGRDKGRKGDKTPTNNTMGDERTLDRRIQLAYTEATNIYTLGSDFTHSELIDAFVKFEKTDHHQVGSAASVDPFAARRGRWVLIYGILQTLASVSVDAPCVRYRGPDVAYHLSPRLRGASLPAKIPPWKGASSQAPPDASHELSHCWTAPATWRRAGETSEDEDGIAGGVDLSNSDEEGAGPGRALAEYADDSSADAVLRMMRSQVKRFPTPPQTQAQTQKPARLLQAHLAASNNNNSGHRAAWGPHAYPASHPHSPGPWSARDSKQSSAAVSVSARSDDTVTTGFTSSNNNNNNNTRGRLASSSSVSGDAKPKSVRSYATFGHGRSAPLSPPAFSAPTFSPTSYIADDSSTVVDDMEWPTRTHSGYYDTAPAAPPPNRPLPLPSAAGSRSGAAAAAAAPSSSSLSYMMARANRGAAAADVNTDVDDDDDDDDYDDNPPPPSRARRDRLEGGRDARLLHHRRVSSDALGHVIRDWEGLSVSNGDGGKSDGADR